MSYIKDELRRIFAEAENPSRDDRITAIEDTVETIDDSSLPGFKDLFTHYLQTLQGGLELSALSDAALYETWSYVRSVAMLEEGRGQPSNVVEFRGRTK